MVRARRVYSLAADPQLLAHVKYPRRCVVLASAKYKDAVVCLQKQDDLCSHYRKWLTAVAECAKALTDSKAAVATAEAEVKVGTSYLCLTAHTDALDQHQPLMLSPLPFTLVWALVWVTGLVYHSGSCT